MKFAVGFRKPKRSVPNNTHSLPFNWHRFAAGCPRSYKLSATANGWSGMLYDGERFYTSRRYHIDYIVDRVGGGDAYSAGIIYGLLTGQDLQETVEFAAAASCLKHSIHGDVNLVSFDEVLALMEGDGSGRIQR